MHLRAAIEAEAAGADGRRLSHAAEELTAQYREGGGAAALRTRDHRLAYALVRMPATLAAARAALAAVAEQLDEGSVRSILDLGAGPGTIAWAAAEVFPELERITHIERDGELAAMGRRFAAASGDEVVRDAVWRTASVTEGAFEPHDLVVASYVAGELANTMRKLFVRAMLDAATVAALVIEPGTPRGFELIRGLRGELIDTGARVIAPCPHSNSCPMSGNDWCHFAARVERTALHRRLKGADLGHEDEKYSYVAVTRLDVAPAASRVIRHPLKRHGHVVLDVCAAEGLERRVITKQHKDVYRSTRKSQWGDAWG